MKIFDFQPVIHHLLSLQKKKFRHCCSDCRFHSTWNKKTKNLIKLEYISNTMTPDCKKIKMQQNGGVLKKKLKFCSKIWGLLAWQNYIFHPIIKLEGHCMEKQIHNKLKEDESRSDDLLSSYCCSKCEKCSFEKIAFKDKSTDFIAINF